MLKFLHRLYQRLVYCTRGRHAWSKSYPHPIIGHPIKSCRYCPAQRAVRARKAKGQHGL